MSLEVARVSKRLAGRPVLDRVTLALDGGPLVIAGPNGCGKSTLLRIVAGVLAPDRGAVRIGGARVPAREALARVGYVPEGADPPEHLSVDELLGLVAGLKRATCPTARSAAMGAGQLYGQRIAGLSLGERRRACIAAALVGDPWLLILDEPENGLDVAGAEQLVALIQAHAGKGGAALIATHDAAFAAALGASRFELPDLRAAG